MNKIRIHTTTKSLLADVFTPVSIYLRLRDRFRDTILLESADFHASENSYSFIGINAIAGIEVMDQQLMEFKLPGQQPEKIRLNDQHHIPSLLWEFMQRFEMEATSDLAARFAQGLYGYCSFDAACFFDRIRFSQQKTDGSQRPIPLMRYRLYQYVIAINHHKDELFFMENRIAGVESAAEKIETLIRNRDLPLYPFQSLGTEISDITDEDYLGMVEKGIAACKRGDVFQIVLSRSYKQGFTGDEFNVYRALRSINPSPYLFYFDYGDYKLMGSSPESQLVVNNGIAVIHPIAGTFKRTGHDEQDKALALALEQDEKENAEHTMLVDLARNDLSRIGNDVEVTRFREVKYYSHVIHLVSEVCAKIGQDANPFHLLGTCFPAGTLSGAPKIRAVELISAIEPKTRGYYGGAIGFAGFNGSLNHAIMIRSFLSRNNVLFSQAGAGIVAASTPENELQEVNNKLQALKKAIELAGTINR